MMDLTGNFSLKTSTVKVKFEAPDGSTSVRRFFCILFGMTFLVILR